MDDKGLGKKQREAWEFIQRVNGWHTYAPDVKRVIMSLEYRGLVDVSEKTKQFRERIYLTCPHCEMLSINSVACHETSCPNMGARFDRESGEWIKQRKCFECGCTVDADDPCCSAPFEEEVSE